MADEERFLLALEEARRSMDQQKEDLKSVRDRAAATLGFGGAGATFLGGLAIRDQHSLSVWTYVGVVAFVILVIAVVVVNLPRTFKFSQDAAAIVLWAEHYNADLGTMRRDLALHLFDQYVENRKVLGWMWLAYQVSIGALVVETLALLTDLGGR